MTTLDQENPVLTGPSETDLRPLVDAPTLLGLIRLEELLAPAEALQRTATLEQVQRVLARTEHQYFAVLDGHRPIGLGSRDRFGFLMGARFGFALYSKKAVTEVLLPDPLVFCADDPVGVLLQQALSRSGDAFHEDVILIDGDGRYLGLIPTWRLAQLQNQLLASEVDRGREQQAALRRTNLDLFRKVAELHQSEARYRTLFNNSGTGFALLDADGTVTSANARLCQLLGVLGEGPVCLFDVLPAERRALFALPVRPGAAVPPGAGAEFALSVPARGERQIRLHRAWIPETGQWCVALDDITEERALQARALEREKRSLLEALVGGVAHELNNKLAPIMGFASMLTEGTSPRDVADFGQLIGQSAAEAARIIQQLLNLSKPAQLQCETFELRQLVADTLALLRFRLRDAGAEVVTPDSEEAVTIYADPGQIRQVLLNLCVNAIDAMTGRPERRLTVGIRPEAEWVRLVVTDTGSGIAPEHLGRIFQPFFTTKGPQAGTGLGLSICGNIVERHGGTILVCNRPEGGAEFTVRLPRLTAAGPAARPDSAAALSAARLSFGGRVLVVDDEEVVARLVQEILQRHFDCEVVRAANGAEALELCTAGSFACIVCDLRMPVMNGLEFYERLAATAPSQCARFVFMSGYEGDVRHRDRLAATGVEVLPKPFGAPALIGLLRRFAVEEPTRGTPTGARPRA